MVDLAHSLPESPRLCQLIDERAGDPTALESFWVEIEADGAPLMEPVADKPGVVLVTFLWRETSPTDNVVLVEWISGLDFPERRMTHLPGTDLWYRSMRLRDHVRSSYQFAPNDSLVPKMDETDWETRQRGWLPDPLNPLTVIDAAGTERPENLARLGDSLLQLPNAAPEPWIVPDPAVPHGLMAHHRFASPSLANEREVWVYAPAGYDPTGVALPVLVLFDGEKHDSVMRVQPVLDNLIAAGKVPPLVALLIGNVDRGTELPCNEPFATAVVDEMLPWLAQSYRVTEDPTQRVVAGQSYGGLAAAWCGLTHPEVFANVLSQSGSYWWQPNAREDLGTAELGDAPGWGWLPTRTAGKPVQPVRFWMEVGTLENRASRHGMPDMVAVNRHMRDVLRAKGYDVTYREYAGGHDYVWWRSSLADGLIALLGTDESELETLS